VGKVGERLGKEITKENKTKKDPKKIAGGGGKKKSWGGGENMPGKLKRHIPIKLGMSRHDLSSRSFKRNFWKVVNDSVVREIRKGGGGGGNRNVKETRCAGGGS